MNRRDRWESRTEWPLTSAAVLFLFAYAWPILHPGLGGAWAAACRAVTWVAWVLFAVDYLVRLALSRGQHAAFVRGNILDLLVIALPLLRPLRLLRLVTLLSVLNRHVGGSLRGRVAVYVGGATALVLFVAALAVLDAERKGPAPNILTFGDALWWAMTTVTTVGYGDRFPTTGTGRLIAASLMLAGIALLGIVTASLASWLLDKVREVQDEGEAATRRDLEALTAELRLLRTALTVGQDYPSPPTAPGRDHGPGTPDPLGPGTASCTRDTLDDLKAGGEPTPAPFSEREYSGKFNVRVGETLHRELALEAAEDGMSLDQLVVRKLAAGR